ncbi:response regulator, partial [Escherichia coli]|nr:response regulator [Escherichia coli]
AFSTGDAGKAAILSQEFDAVVSDVRLPDSDGLSILESLIDHHIQTPVILITGHGDVDMAVSALQKGAFDFIEKPFQPERLSQRVTEAVETYRAQTSTQDRQEYLASVSGLEEVLIGRSRVMQQLREQVAKLARIDT